MTSELILIAGREPKVISLLRQVLISDGFEVIAAAKDEQAVQLAAAEQPVLILLPTLFTQEGDGLEVVRRVREFSDTPIILITDCASSEEELRGFNLGADDYITRPFDPRVLLARVRALLKRAQASGPKTQAEIVSSDLVIDLAAHRVTRSGTEIYLTETEYNLLLELARHQNRVLLHDQLLVAVWGSEFRNEVGYLRSYIHILRRKIEDDPSQPRLILSRPGIGYMFAAAPRENSGV